MDRPGSTQHRVPAPRAVAGYASRHGAYVSKLRSCCACCAFSSATRVCCTHRARHRVAAAAAAAAVGAAAAAGPRAEPAPITHAVCFAPRVPSAPPTEGAAARRQPAHVATTARWPRLQPRCPRWSATCLFSPRATAAAPTKCWPSTEYDTSAAARGCALAGHASGHRCHAYGQHGTAAAAVCTSRPAAIATAPARYPRKRQAQLARQPGCGPRC